ncbi:MULTISPECIES: amidohydrolase [Ensifer]|jgi:predicted amidohydrolase YtcJ|uniref:amidohydrolase n=1 Tax=Ensifer TaxID=106591 RepID=UPI00071618BB|nr:MULTISPECIES: amidohydrolase [Ensifer]KSV66878.1 amidohydrolase [Sinorhizobium sp. GW3]KSV78545.1 amidohydrolase [Sinorhizobium sp. GL2]KQX58149.1 amidohydrolase [Ensifer sp. Root1298]KQX84153.1 amidohydrolase [Ensifer sp. Root1312]KRC22406.1 amidohydrolase [Ensifer sp. Root74]
MAFQLHADLILHNGRIWRGREEGISEAVAIWQGKVLATGSDAEMASLKGPHTKVIDLEGRFASPGLIDNHLHLISTGITMGWVDATPAAAPTLAALMEKLAERAAVTPKGAWVRARGYDQVKLDVGRHPTREELDRAVPDHPVLLTRACGHVAIANSLALSLADVTEATPVPDGGVIGTTDGRLNGFLAENAQNLIKTAIPEVTTEELIDGIERAGRYLLSLGITSCMDAAVGQLAGFAEIQAYEMAKLSGRLPVRVWLTLLGDPGVSIVEDSWRAGLISGAGDDMLRVGAVKIFLDGSAGGRTAWMSKPYLGEPDNIGVQMLPDADVEAIVKSCHDRGYQMACHAIGDGAIEQLITAYEKALAGNPDPDRRHRIEHCGFSSPEQDRRMKAAGILPAPQMAFIHDFGDSYVSVLGEERGKASYQIGTWMRMGLKPSTGSDSPVCSPDPFPNLHAMITRKTGKGTVMVEAEKLSREEALQAYTEYGAYSQKAEDVKGRLVPGQWADIAVFDNDLLEAPADTILSGTRCLMTLLAGRVVHDAR